MSNKTNIVMAYGTQIHSISFIFSLVPLYFCNWYFNLGFESDPDRDEDQVIENAMDCLEAYDPAHGVWVHV